MTNPADQSAGTPTPEGTPRADTDKACRWCEEKYPRVSGKHFVDGAWNTPCVAWDSPRPPEPDTTNAVCEVCARPLEVPDLKICTRCAPSRRASSAINLTEPDTPSVEPGAGSATHDTTGRLSDAQKHMGDCLCPCHKTDSWHINNVGCQRALMYVGEQKVDALQRTVDALREESAAALRASEAAVESLTKERDEAKADAANFQRLMLNLVADNDACSLVLADIAKVIGVFTISGGWYRPNEFAALVAMHIHQREDAARAMATKPLRKAAQRLLAVVFYVDNGTCSICHGYWPSEHRDGCQGLALKQAIERAR